MGDKNYQRTSGYKNYMKKRCYLPIIERGIAYSGDRRYVVREDGWRKMNDGGK